MKNRKKIAMAALFTGLALIFTLSFSGCNSTKEIPDDLSAPQLLQKGQTSLDTSDFKAAEKYFLKAIELYGDNTETYIESRYELGHLYIRTKSYEKAYAALTEILEIYDLAPYGSLPPAYKKLAQLELNKIPAAKYEELEARGN